MDRRLQYAESRIEKLIDKVVVKIAHYGLILPVKNSALPYGWAEYFDSASRTPYYVSPMDESTWTRPVIEDVLTKVLKQQMIDLLSRVRPFLKYCKTPADSKKLMHCMMMTPASHSCTDYISDPEQPNHLYPILRVPIDGAALDVLYRSSLPSRDWAARLPAAVVRRMGLENSERYEGAMGKALLLARLDDAFSRS